MPSPDLPRQNCRFALTQIALVLCASLAALDGDTLICDSEKIRLSNIDGPEVFRPSCPQERIMAYRAALRANALLEGKVKIAREGKDGYGRTLARVTLEDGRDLGAVLVAEGHARIWAGRRENWCADLALPAPDRD